VESFDFCLSLSMPIQRRPFLELAGDHAHWSAGTDKGEVTLCSALEVWTLNRARKLAEICSS